MAADLPSKRRTLLRAPSGFLRRMFRASAAMDKKPTNVATQWLEGLGPVGPDYDPRVIPQLIDRLALKRPNAVWGTIPKTKDPADGFRDITYRDYAHGINRAAAWLEDIIGKDTRGQVIAYLAVSQVSSVLLVTAASKLGCQILFLSPRNSLEGQLALIDQTKTTFLCTPAVQLPQTKVILRERPSLKHVVSPSLDDFLRGPVPPVRPFTENFEDIRHKPFWYVHSSGTTSLPKLVGWTHGANASLLHEFTCEYPEGQTLMQNMIAAGPRFFTSFPIFHAGGILFPLLDAPISGVECVFPPVDVPVTAELCDKMHISSKAPFTACEPPIVIEELVKEPQFFERMIKHVPVVVTGAAALPKSIGDKLVQHGVPVRNIIASSEMGIPPMVVPQPETEWNAMSFPSGQGLEFDEVGEGIHEMVFRRLKGSPRVQGVFENYPDKDIYRTNDMFIKHPDADKRHLWMVSGRADDVIVLLNGEKFTPTALEEEVQSQVGVKGTLVFGMQREQSALLVEPADESIAASSDASRDFLDKLWPEIEKANLKIAAHGRIQQTHVMVIKPDKPLLRTPKGSVQRSKVYALYASEMDELYEKHSDANSDTTAVGEILDHRTIDLKLRICKLIGIEPARLDEDDNIFAAGFDSLNALQLTRELQKSMGRENFEQVMIYNNPTIRQLSAIIGAHSKNSQTRNVAPDGHISAYDTSSVAALVGSITESLPSAVPAPTDKIAILTGSSGGLGQHLVESLRGSYTHIYCLLRQPPSKNASQIPGITYLQSDLSAPNLGIMPAQHTTLLRSVTHIIHNAWLVDFNQPLPFFAKNVDSVRGLIAFAALARQNPRIFFISSVSSVIGLYSDMRAETGIPETVPALNDASDTVPAGAGMGYAQSKRAGELLLARAAEVAGVRATIVRVGQIGGTSKPGMLSSEGTALPSWQTRDWLPRLLASSRYLKAVPSDLGGMGHFEWTPIDVVAGAITDMANANEGSRSPEEALQVFHVTNPATPPSWPDLLPVIRRELGRDRGGEEAIEVVSAETWVEMLEASVKGGEKAAPENSGAQLAGFYRGALLPGPNGYAHMPKLGTTRATAVSAMLRDVKPMNEEWMGQWLKEWFPEES